MWGRLAEGEARNKAPLPGGFGSTDIRREPLPNTARNGVGADACPQRGDGIEIAHGAKQRLDARGWKGRRLQSAISNCWAAYPLGDKAFLVSGCGRRQHAVLRRGDRRI